MYLCEWTMTISISSSNNSIHHHHQHISRKKKWEHRFRFFILTCAALIGLLSATTMAFNGTYEYFTPFSTRIKGLFGTSALTGNPLVDSVTEHQPADFQAYFHYLQHLCTAGPIGFIFILFYFGDGPSFLFVYAISATILSLRMVRLLLLMAPIASILGGITIGRIISWIFCEICHDEYDYTEENNYERDASATTTSGGGGDGITATATTTTPASPNSNSLTIIHTNGKKHKRGSKKKGGAKNQDQHDNDGINIELIIRTIIAFATLGLIMLFSSSFQNYCLKSSRVLSNPMITQLAQSSNNGSIIKVDDYRESYAWLKEHTEEDARILAWWDYGYQITALADRTTLADGNTWNHEHIALIGKILTTNEAEGHAIARHLADYVLIYAGGGSDDLAKSPYIARIANSVYRSVCPGDVTCRNFRFMVRAYNMSFVL